MDEIDLFGTKVQIKAQLLIQISLSNIDIKKKSIKMPNEIIMIYLRSNLGHLRLSRLGHILDIVSDKYYLLDEEVNYIGR